MTAAGTKQLVVNVPGTSYYRGDAATFIADASFHFNDSAKTKKEDLVQERKLRGIPKWHVMNWIHMYIKRQIYLSRKIAHDVISLRKKKKK